MPAAREDAGASNVREGYRRYTLEYGVSVEIPNDWLVLTQQQVAGVRAEADRLYQGGDTAKDTQFAANSSSDPERNEAQVRISFLTKKYEESDLRKAKPEDWEAFCENLYSSWQKTQMPLQMIGRPKCSTTSIKGRLALLTHYQRHGRTTGETWTVNMLQIPLNEKVVLLTFSQRDGSERANQLIADIAAKLRFDEPTQPSLPFMESVEASGPPRQTLSHLSIGNQLSQAMMLGTPAAIGTYKSYVQRKWNLASGNDISITADGAGRIVYMESDWGGNEAGRAADFQDLVFGVTTLSDLRKRFGSNGFAFKERGPVTKEPDGVVMINSYEVGKNVVTFFTKVTYDSSSFSADRATLVAISIADPEYAKDEWGDRFYDPSYRKVE